MIGKTGKKSSNRWNFLTGAAAAAVLLLAVSASAMRLSFAELDLKTYASPSGTFRLTVTPDNRKGSDGAEYRLEKNHAEVWSGHRPFALWEAGVTDDGSVAGYAYSLGFEGMWKGSNTLSFILIDPAGEARTVEVLERHQALYCGGSPTPSAHGVIVDAPRDRFLVCVLGENDDRTEKWWVYRISTGERVTIFDPLANIGKEINAGTSIKSVLLPGTSLILGQWWIFGAGRSTHYALVDETGKSVWTLDRPQDFEIEGDEKTKYTFERWVRENSTILNVSATGRFDLAFPSENVGVSFEAQQEASGKWRVRETGRHAFAWNASVSTEAQGFPAKRLRLIGTTPMRPRSHVALSPIRDVTACDVDVQGNICFVRRTAESLFDLVQVRTNGTVIREVPLWRGVDGKHNSIAGMCRVGPQQFVVAAHGATYEGSNLCVLVDVENGTAADMPGFNPGYMKGLSSFPDGRMVYTVSDKICCIGPDGVRLWSHGGGGYGHKDDDILSPEDVCVDSSGRVVLLDVIRHCLQLFDGDGKFICKRDLADAWKREPSYPTQIVADKDGGVTIYDFQGTPSVVHMDSGGAVIDEFDLRDDAGRRYHPISGIRTAPDGSYWFTDGHLLLRADARGVVDTKLGAATDPESIERAVAVQTDWAGHIFVTADKTFAVHVFDELGAPLWICAPAATDYTVPQWKPDFAVAPEGDVYLAMKNEAHDVIHFSPGGQREGTISFTNAGSISRVRIQPGSGRAWIQGYDSIEMCNLTGGVSRTLAKKPDGTWLESIRELVFAPDGTAAVMDQSGITSSNTCIHVYDADGNPIRTIFRAEDFTLNDSPKFAFDGAHLALRRDDTIYVMDSTENPEFSFAPDDAGLGHDFMGPFLVRDGSELWLVAPESLTVYRYELF